MYLFLLEKTAKLTEFIPCMNVLNMCNLHVYLCVRYMSRNYTPQPLYNTIAEVQANFHVSYPVRVVTRVKCIDI